MACKTLVHRLLDPWIIEKINEEERKKKEEKRPSVYIEDDDFLPSRKDPVRERITYIEPPEKKDDQSLYIMSRKVF